MFISLRALLALPSVDNKDLNSLFDHTNSCDAMVTIVIINILNIKLHNRQFVSTISFYPKPIVRYITYNDTIMKELSKYLRFVSYKMVHHADILSCQVFIYIFIVYIEICAVVSYHCLG